MIQSKDNDMKKEEMTIGKRLKDLRHSKNMTQQELAKILFVSDKTISKWEKDGSIPDIDILVVLSNLYDVSLDYLLTGKDNSKSVKGGYVVYNKDGSIAYYVGEDGDRLFTRGEVTTILKKRIARHDQKLLDQFGFKSMDDLELVAKTFKRIKEVVKDEDQ